MRELKFPGGGFVFCRVTVSVHVGLESSGVDLPWVQIRDAACHVGRFDAGIW